jgi:hypothetical protein
LLRELICGSITSGGLLQHGFATACSLSIRNTRGEFLAFYNALVLLLWGSTFSSVNYPSPRWQINKGREEAAYVSLAKMHASGDRDDGLVVNQFREIKEGLDQDKLEHHTGYP